MTEPKAAFSQSLVHFLSNLQCTRIAQEFHRTKSTVLKLLIFMCMFFFAVMCTMCVQVLVGVWSHMIPWNQCYCNCEQSCWMLGPETESFAGTANALNWRAISLDLHFFLFRLCNNSFSLYNFSKGQVQDMLMFLQIGWHIYVIRWCADTCLTSRIFHRKCCGDWRDNSVA